MTDTTTDTTYAMADTTLAPDPARDQFIREEIVKQYERSLRADPDEPGISAAESAHRIMERATTREEVGPVAERRRTLVEQIELLDPLELDIVAGVIRGLVRLSHT